MLTQTRIKSESIKSTLDSCFSLLTKREKSIVRNVALVHALLNILDLFAVLCVGYLGSRAINFGLETQKSQIILNDLERFSLLFKLGLSEVEIIKFLVVLVFLLFLLKTCLSIVLTKKLYFFLGDSGARISKALISSMLNNTYVFTNRKTSQENLYSFTSGVSLITTQILPTVFLLFSDLVLIVILVSCVLILNTSMALLSITSVLLIVSTLYLIMHSKAEMIGREKYEFGLESQNQVLNLFSLQQEIKGSGNAAFHIKKFDISRKKFSRAEAKLNFYPYLSKYIVEISLVSLTLLAILVQVGSYNSNGSFGPIAVFLASLTRIFPALLRSQQNIVLLRSNYPYIHPTIKLASQFENLDLMKSVTEPSHNQVTEFYPSVSFENVCADYEENSEFSIRDVSLEINPGSVVAIVGPSGSGKTTIASLILGSMEPSSGQILISGQHPRTARRIWPGAIAFVPQEVFIMNASIEENITLSDTVNEDVFRRVVKASNLETFIRSSESGAKTILQEKGMNLSGGEKQRIGIARALYSNPRILVLDEATSSLDSENENVIMQSLLALKGDLTLIFVAHRLSTVVNADQLLYVHAGKIVARGSFEDLRNLVPDFNQQAGLLGL